MRYECALWPGTSDLIVNDCISLALQTIGNEAIDASSVSGYEV